MQKIKGYCCKSFSIIIIALNEEKKSQIFLLAFLLFCYINKST